MAHGWCGCARPSVDVSFEDRAELEAEYPAWSGRTRGFRGGAASLGRQAEVLRPNGEHSADLRAEQDGSRAILPPVRRRVQDAQGREPTRGQLVAERRRGDPGA